jgi:hypothetical protein
MQATSGPRVSLVPALTKKAPTTIAVGLSPGWALHLDPAGRSYGAVDAGLVLCHDALKSSRATFGQQAFAIVECLGVQKMGDSRPADQVTKSTLAVLEMDGAQIMAVELHEIERPQHEIVFDALVHLSVE